MNDSQIDKIVLVVHGVGDPLPGQTLNHFARSLARDETPLVEQQNTIWLGEKATVPGHTKTFPAHIRKLPIDGQQIEMAEVFWGDLSKVKQGMMGLLYGMFQILFGLRYVAYIAADQPGRAALILKKLGLMSSRILQGPVLALTCFLVLITAAAIGTDMIWVGSYRDLDWTRFLMIGSSVLTATIAMAGSRITRSRVIERFWFWIAVVTGFVMLMVAIKTLWIDVHYPEVNCSHCALPGLIWYCRVLVVLLGSLWFVESLVMIAMAGCWIAAIFHPRVYRPAIHLAFLLPALTLGIWGQTLPMVWVFARQSVERIGRIPEFVATFNEAVPLLGVQFLMLVATALVTIAVLMKYFYWKVRHHAAGRPTNSFKEKPSPRIIVNSAQQVTLAVCTMTGVSLVFLICTMNALGIAYQSGLFGQTLMEMNKYAVVFMVPLSGLAFLALPYLRPGFDIVLDAVNHFYFRATNIDDALDDDDEFDIQETTFESGSMFFSRRDTIHCRLKKILVYYRDRLHHRPELVIVSHSQGTMIAVESLNDPEMAWLASTFSKTTLVTMGSPLTHLYQHYFGHHYPSLNAPFWDEFRQQVDAWVNVYRIDDFVGQEIDFPVPVRAVGGLEHADSTPDCQQYPLGCRGHMNYWNDKEALDIIRREVFAPKESLKVRRAA